MSSFGQDSKGIERFWLSAFEWMRGSMKYNATVLVSCLIKCDSQQAHQRLPKQFISELWQYILDSKDNSTAISCFVQILGVKNQGESIQFVLQTLQSGSTNQVLSAITVLHQLFDIMLSHTKQFGQT